LSGNGLEFEAVVDSLLTVAAAAEVLVDEVLVFERLFGALILR